MKNKIHLFLGIFFSLLVVLVYKVWFIPGAITGGDFWYYFPSMYDNHSIIPSASLFFVNNGFGGPSILFSSVNFILGIPFFFGKQFNISWDILERIFILFPFLIASALIPIFVFRRIFPKNLLFFISPIIFLFNSYILMLVSGGLVVIGIAYSLIPLAFFIFIKISESKSILNKKILLYSIFLGLVLATQTILDLRISYITLSGFLIFFLIHTFQEKNLISSLRLFLCSILIPIIVSILINAFWILPALFNGVESFKGLGEAYTSSNAVKFLSFATFENSISLLHPNWPENIFGKVSFMKPEFLIFPLLAFGSLFFVKKENKKIILPLVMISLVGSFLAKGTNDPFGNIYTFLFEKIPGFILFRDSSKWYMLVAFSFSILIPFTLYEIYKKIGKLGIFVPIFFVAYFAFLINPAILGKLPGTLKTSVVPNEYNKFEFFLSSEKSFSRVLWIPSPSRFSYFSANHPEVSGDLYFNNSNPIKIVKKLNYKVLFSLVSKGVRYIVVPSDERGEIFIKDRKYNEKEYEETISLIDKTKDLKEVKGFGKLKLYEINFWNSNIPQENSLKVYPKIQNLTNVGSFISIASFILFLAGVIYLNFK